MDGDFDGTFFGISFGFFRDFDGISIPMGFDYHWDFYGYFDVILREFDGISMGFYTGIPIYGSTHIADRWGLDETLKES